VGATLAIALVSYVATPDLWQQWASMLRADLALAITGSAPYLPIALWVRLPPAILLVVWGARRDHSWTVAVAVTLALPTIWVQSLPVLLGAAPSLVRSGSAGRWTRRVHARVASKIEGAQPRMMTRDTDARGRAKPPGSLSLPALPGNRVEVIRSADSAMSAAPVALTGVFDVSRISTR
jgi:hypothetical protein